MKNNLFDLSGQVAFCCGGSLGLGFSSPRRWPTRAQTSRSSPAAPTVWTKTPGRSRAEYGVKVYPHYMDLQDSKSITDCVSDVVAHFGKIDILVNAAAFRAAATRPRSRMSTGSTSSTPTSTVSSSPAARSCASP